MEFHRNPTRWSLLCINGLVQAITVNHRRSYERIDYLAKIESELVVKQMFIETVAHMYTFYLTRYWMYRSKNVCPILKRVHEIDRFDPIMLVAYTERYQDGVHTRLFEKCSDLHHAQNVHYQSHYSWQEEDDIINAMQHCSLSDDVHQGDKENYLLEMICCMASRRFAENGIADMWKASAIDYQGLPSKWMDRVIDVLARFPEVKTNGS